jgi:hypothetical protein
MEPAEPRQRPRVARELVAVHVGERMPLSGAARYQGNGSDVNVYAFRVVTQFEKSSPFSPGGAVPLACLKHQEERRSDTPKASNCPHCNAKP